MAAIPDEIIQRVRDAHDIVDVVGRTLELKRSGAAWKACCPFHEEKTPSFQVNQRLQIFKCFGCGKGGNVFHWLMETRGLTFPEAVRQLADERSIAVPLARGADPGVSRDARARLGAALDAAHGWFRAALAAPVGAEARAYLERRGYDAARCAEFGLGFAPPTWDGLVQALGRRGLAGATLEDAGLARRRDRGGFYDAFRHRVMFPIRDAQGRLVTFAGRTLDPNENAKYVNGPETALFRKSDVLYALDRAAPGIRRRGEALVMEGYTDVLMTHAHGFDHAVAAMGTAFTDAQARLLGRFADRAVLLYDGDAAGQAAAERTLDVLLPIGLDVRIAVLPAGRDVDEILLEEGPGALEAILGNARDWFAHRLARERERHDLSTVRGRSAAAESLLATIVRVKSEIERTLRVKELAESLGGDLGGVDAEAVLRRVAGASLARRAGASGASAASGPAPVRRRSAAAVDHARESQIGYLAGAFADPLLADAILRSVGPEEFSTPVLRRMYEGILDLAESGRPLLRENLAARLVEDAEALAELASLPDDPTLAERVRCQIAFLEQRRLAEERKERLRAQVRAAAAGLVTSASEVPPEPARPAAARADPGQTPSGGPGPAGARSGVPPAGPGGEIEEFPCDEIDPLLGLPVFDGPPPEDRDDSGEGATHSG